MLLIALNWLIIGVEKGSKDPKQQKVGKITIEQLRAIATEKLPDLNCTSIESAMRIIAGTAANMGIDIDPPVLDTKKKELWLFHCCLDFAIVVGLAVASKFMMYDQFLYVWVII